MSPTRRTPIAGPGTQNLTVTLKTGTYDLFCSVPGHKALGMDTHITVGSGGGSAGGRHVLVGWRRRQQQRRRLELSRTLTPVCGSRVNAGE